MLIILILNLIEKKLIYNCFPYKKIKILLFNFFSIYSYFTDKKYLSRFGVTYLKAFFFKIEESQYKQIRSLI